ncbi:MAG: hypothetical protein D3923_14270 [Candidatus Electrothrix sp. AR3]|nr:hypothetical protein [Candidatus Electrothrix sp. AR3]
METAAGAVPRVKSVLGFRDHLGTLRVRTGIIRNRYKVNPGLYGVGDPSPESPVFVTANYKLSFDTLRKELTDLDSWILVVDTRGINVWCAAGKRSFSTDEVALQVQQSGLERVVSHREVILPQFAAIGVALHELKKRCGFKGVFGPIRAEDIPEFIRLNRKADESQRSVTFSLAERLILVPVEITLIWKQFFLAAFAGFIASGIGPDIYSFAAAWARGWTAVGATAVAILTGALAVPALLPWIPGRQFWFKGTLTGAVGGIAYLLTVMAEAGIAEQVGIWLWIMASSSYMAMNFTGSTPFTSLSGVEQEMQKGLPIQCGSVLLGLLLWLIAPFIGV